MENHSSILAWEMLWTEEPGRLQSMGSQESDTTLQLNQEKPVFEDPRNVIPTCSPISFVPVGDSKIVSGTSQIILASSDP